MQTYRRILFVGNSITLHGPLAEIGWVNNWGMAASAPENDYVHVAMRLFRALAPDAEMEVFNAADFERSYATEGTAKAQFIIDAAEQFRPDLVVMRVAECVGPQAAEHDFGPAYAELIRKLAEPGQAKVVCTTDVGGFEPVSAPIRKVARENGYGLVELGFIGANDENKAIGKFWHGGVAGHPGDLGMARIAIAVFEAAMAL